MSQETRVPSFPYEACGARRLVFIASALLFLDALAVSSPGLPNGDHNPHRVMRSDVEVDSRGRASTMRRELGTSETMMLKQDEPEMQVFQTSIELPGLDTVSYEPAFFNKCLQKWQDMCRADYSHDSESDQMFCESNLDREYLKARLLVPKEHIRAHFDHSRSGLTARNKTIYEGLRLPKYTEDGYAKMHVAADLHARFTTWFQNNRHMAVPESPPVTGKWCDNDYDNDDFVVATCNGADELVEELKATLIPALEEWAQVKLDPESITYGARMYHRGSICAMHTDENSDHIISAVYHLNERGLKEEWPLDVVDHNGREQSITSRPGDLIFYESATTPHGRKGTYQGEEFTNIFFHFKPIGWKEAREAAYLMMLPYNMSNDDALYVEPVLKPASFHGVDKCLPYGVGNAFSGAFNTSVMRLALTHDGKGVHTANAHRVEKSLLDTSTQGLDIVAKRMMYWKGAEGEKDGTRTIDDKPSGEDGKYMLFDIDIGGLNNIRIGWEMAGLVAFHTGRTLVLPPAMPWYLIDDGPGIESTGSTSLIEDFVNLPQLQRGLKVLTFAEFSSKEFPESTSFASTREAWEEFASEHATVVNSSCDIDHYSLEDRMIYVHDVVDKGSRLFQCGRWNEVGQASFMKAGDPWVMPAPYETLLRNHFVWHPEVLQLASHVVNTLGLFQYVALHARYNDFQFKEDRESPQAIVDRWMVHFDRWLGKSNTIYVSTDGSNPEAFVQAVQHRMPRPMKVVLAADIFDKPTSPIAELLADMNSKRVQQLKGPIEQVICSFAKVFVGTKQSTFSGYIELMRSYANAPQHVTTNSVDTTRLVHTEDPSADLAENVEKQLKRWAPHRDVSHRRVDSDRKLKLHRS